jgi:hypothetical protein
VYSPRHYDILLAHMVRTPAVLELALRNLEPQYLSRPEVGGSFAQAMLFEIIKNHHEKFGTVPDPAVLITESAAIIERLLTPGGVEYSSAKTKVMEFLTAIKLVDDRSVELARQIVAHIVKVCVHDQAIQAALQEAHEATETGSPIEAVGRKLIELEQRARATLGGNAQHNVLTTRLSNDADRITTGIPFLDSRLGSGNGPTTRCALAIIAPQGAGKTTLGVQLSINQALMQRHSLLVLAEEGLTVPLQRNLIACATNIPTPLLEKHKNDVDAACLEAGLDRDITRTRLETVDKYLHVLDLNENPGTMLEIEAQVDTMCMAGQTPVYTYIDWAGMLADRIMSTGMGGQSFDDKYDALKAISYRCAQLAGRASIQVCIAQQMAPAVATKGFHCPNDQFCAADCKGFTEPMKYVFTINKPDMKSGLSLVNIAKARNDRNNQAFLCRLRGELAQFVDVSDQFALRGKRVVNLTQKGPNVPKED